MLKKVKLPGPTVSEALRMMDISNNTVASLPPSKLPQVSLPASLPKLPVTDADLESIGSDLSRKVGATTDKIMATMKVGRFEDLGDILTKIQTEAQNLDPASIQKGGVVGWWQRNFSDIKQQLTLKLKSAEQVFTGLEEKIATHIAVQSQWVKDLDILFDENYQRWVELGQTVKKLDVWEANSKTALDSWPQIEADDPDAMMKAQARRDAESLLNRVRLKADSFKRLRVIAESNSPRIRSQQQTSRDNIETLRQIIEQVIPMIKIDFTMFLQSLDAKKSIELVQATRQLANKTLKTSADSAKTSALDAAKNLNSATVETQTLNHIRSRMLETVTEVRRIESEAHQLREKDAVEIANSQKTYLQALTQNGAFK